MNSSTVKQLLAYVCCLLLVACSSSSEKRERIDYKKNDLSQKSLDLPPDLTQPELVGSMVIPGLAVDTGGGRMLLQSGGGGVGRAQVLPERIGARIARDGALRWLEIDLPAEPLWLKLRKFWEELGLEIKRDEPAIGLMETAWEENRADIPESGIRAMIARAFKGAYSAPTRDKYRVRLEPLEGDVTALFLTHYGVEQIYVEDGTTGQAIWQRRPSDTELSNEILNRLLRVLGVPKGLGNELLQATVDEVLRARLVEGDSVEAIALNESYRRAWRHVGVVLDRLGVVVEDRNRSAGIFYITLTELSEELSEEEGWFASLFSDDDEEQEPLRYRVTLQPEGESTLIKLSGVDGGAVDPEVRKVVLSELNDALQ